MKSSVSYFGPAGSFTHRAARRRFGAQAIYVPAASVAEVVERARVGAVRWGVIPFENVVGGFLDEALIVLLGGSFGAEGLRVCGEQALCIDLALVGRGPLDRVRVVYSHRYPLLRCRDWVNKHLPGARLEEAPNTAAAAARAARERGAAAIASAEAARRYGLRVLCAAAGPPGANVTHFLVVGREPLPRSRPTQTMLWFTLPHRSGALARALALLAREGINLTRIASHPLVGRVGEYAFLVTFTGHPGTPRADRALARLRRFADDLALLGSYPTWGWA